MHDKETLLEERLQRSKSRFHTCIYTDNAFKSFQYYHCNTIMASLATDIRQNAGWFTEGGRMQ